MSSVGPRSRVPAWLGATVCLFVLAGCQAASPSVESQDGDWYRSVVGLEDLPAPVTGPPLVAIVDTAVDADHPLLQGRLQRRWVAPGASSEPAAHGTGMALLVAARSSPSWAGGLDPRARLLSAAVFDRAGNASTEAVVAALDWSVQEGAEVIVMSLAFQRGDRQLSAAVERAAAAGVLLVAAAGNSLEDEPAYPAAYDEVLGVTSINERRGRGAFAAWATADVAAPGEQVVVPVEHHGALTPLSGTSVAAALAGGVISRCLWRHSEDVSQLRTRLLDAATDLARHDGRSLPIIACPATG